MAVYIKNKPKWKFIVGVSLFSLIFFMTSGVVYSNPPVASEAAMAMEALGLLEVETVFTDIELEQAWKKAYDFRSELEEKNLFTRLALDQAQGYTYLLGGFSTPLKASDTGRNHNIKVAAFYLDHLLIPPGGIFSFNSATGKRTLANGYVYAKQLYMGQPVTGVGGGICQVATTIFNAALLSGFQVLKHTPHSQTVYYISPGRDATVADGIDLVLKNDSGQEVLLVAKVVEDRLNISFYGSIKPKVTYLLETREIGEVPITFINDNESERDWLKVEQGLRVQLWRVSSLGVKEFIAQADYAVRVINTSGANKP
jgi:hypothetical protein